MRLKEYITELSKGKGGFKFNTAKDQTGHSHIAEMNENGDGKTIKTIGMKDHTHKVFQWIVQPAEGHIHNLEDKKI